MINFERKKELFKIRKWKRWILFLSAVLTAGFLSVQTNAEGELQFSDIVDFTDVSLWYADESGKPDQKIEGGAEPLLEKNVGLALCYSYEIKDGMIGGIAAYTPYYLAVSTHLAASPGLKGGEPLTVEIEGKDSEEFGKLYAEGAKAWIIFKADESGTGTVLAKLLTENDIDSFQGTFYLQCGRAAEPPDLNEENRYTMEVEGRDLFTFGYKEKERTERKAAVKKNGSLTGKTITWTIEYTPWQNPNPAGPDQIAADTVFELRDTIDASMHSYIENSVIIDGISVADSASRESLPDDRYVVVENTERGTVLNIGGNSLRAGKAAEGDTVTPITITYQTTLRDTLLLPGYEGKPEIANTAKLCAQKDGSFRELGINDSHKITVEPLTWTQKEGTTTRVNGSGSYTDWTVTFDPNGFTFPSDSALKFHDQLPESSTLAADSITIDGAAVHAGDIATEEGNRFSFSVDKEVTGPVTIKYRTTVSEATYEEGTDLKENTAWFTFQYLGKEYETPHVTKPVDSGGGSGTSGTALLVKSNGGYLAGSRSIEWTVDINPHRAYLKSGTFTDNLSETAGEGCGISGHGKGLELAGDVSSIDVLLEGPETEAEKAELRNRISLVYDSASQVLTVTVGDIGFTKVTLRYRTKVCDPCIFANNSKAKPFVNKISTDDMMIGNGSPQRRSAAGESTVDVNASVLTQNSPVYDYGRGVMRWTLEVNAAGLPMKDIALTDTLPAGVTYMEGDGTFSANIKDTFRTDLVLSGAAMTVSDGGKNLAIRLDDIGTAKVFVTFETKVDPMSAGFNSDKDVEIVNTAMMNGTADGLSFEGVSDTVRKTFVNHGLVKSSKTNNEEEWIEYEVLINPYGLTLPQTFSLVDTLDKRLQLSDDTPIQAYRATVSGTSENQGQKPTYVRKTDVPGLKIDGSVYDPEKNSITVNLRLPDESAVDPEPAKSAYVLVYRTDILERQSDSYSNSVRFEGGAVKLGGEKQNNAQVSGGGGGGSGVLSRKAVISVTHADSSTGAPLSGVVFTLYEWDTTNHRRLRAVARGVTDSQGKVSFKVKPGGVYELVQTKGISGYDDVPGWEHLPGGVQQGGAGLLVTAEAAGSTRALQLTNTAGRPTGPNAPGNTSQPGNTGTGGSGSTGDGSNAGGSAGDGSNTDRAADGGSLDSAKSGANPDGTEGTQAGIAADGAETGDDISGSASRLFFLGIVSGSLAVFLLGTGKKRGRKTGA